MASINLKGIKFKQKDGGKKMAEFKVSKKGKNVLVTIEFEQATPVVFSRDMDELIEIFERRRNREHRYANIRRFEMVRATLEYANSLDGAVHNMFNEKANFNLELTFDSESKKAEFYDGVFNFVVEALHELNKILVKRGNKN